jgi:V/A-type H+-transporting ATPase subunit I
MAVVPMQKIRLLVHTSDASAVLNVVQKMGIVEFSEVKNSEHLFQKEKEIFEYNYASSRLDFAVEFLSRYDTSKGKIRSIIEGMEARATEKEIERIVKNFSYNIIIDRLENLEQQLNIAKKKKESLRKEKIILEQWVDLDIRLGQPLETKETKTIFVEKKHSQSRRSEEKKTPSSILDQEKAIHWYRAFSETEQGVLTYFRKDEESVKKALALSEYEIADLPKRRGTPKEEIERINRALSRVESRIAEYEKEIKRHIPDLPNLKILSDALLWKKEKYNVLTSAKTTKTVLVFEGWCHKERFLELKDHIAQKTNLFSLDIIKKEKREKIPVAIENTPLIKPFETITRLYGLPAYKEFDPTIFLAGFFFLFFGLCLTDVLYGLFLFALTAGVLYFYRVPENSKPLIKLLMYGGISSAIIGLFFGGYLGISMEHFPKWLQTLQQFDPIANPLPIFYLSLALGFVQIIFGIVLKMLTKFKNGERLDGILDEGSWLVFFLALVLYGANMFDLIEVMSETATIPLYGAVALLVITQGRKEKVIWKKLFVGISSLYGLVGYFSDVLSYSRLLALGLATSALAFAINLIAEIVGDMVPVIGPVLAVLILIGGHLFNIMINTLGAFIHSARLQFVEFFGKFIIGGGRVMMPFEREQRYVIIEKESGRS